MNFNFTFLGQSILRYETPIIVKVWYNIFMAYLQEFGNLYLTPKVV
jgi:hypothetical protein